MVTRYVVRDVRTKGVDYLLWGDDDPVGARTSLIEAQAQFGEDAVELVTMPSHCIDDHTRRLIEGDSDVQLGTSESDASTDTLH